MALGDKLQQGVPAPHSSQFETQVARFSQEVKDTLEGYTAPTTTTIADDAIWDAKGDIVAATGADAAVKVTVGSDGKVLTADSAATPGVSWQTPVTLATDTLWDAKGDMVSGSGANTAVKTSVGSDGQVWTADSGATGGASWQDVSSPTYAYLTSDVTVTGTSWQDFTGTGIAVVAGTYIVEIAITMTRGGYPGLAVVGINGPTTSLLQLVAVGEISGSTNTQLVSSYDTQIFGTSAAGAEGVARGLITFTASGTLILRGQGAAVLETTTAKAGCWLKVLQVA